MRRSREAAIPCLRGTRDHTRQRPDSVPMVLPDEPDEFVDTLLPIRQNYDCIYKLVQFIREDRRRQPESSPSPARVLSESRPESFPESYGIPSPSRVFPESPPSPARVLSESS
jgi:hypothetical protein